MNTLLLYAGIALTAGALLGVALFPWAASPLPGPGFKLMGGAFGRIFLTVSQMIRGKGVLVKRANNAYEIGTYDADTESIVLSDGRFDAFNADATRWTLFGKRPFAVTWEPGTDLHRRVRTGDGDINMGAAHRLMRGGTEADAITRTEEDAKAKHGGGSDGLSDLVMAVLVGAMLIMGSLTTFFML